MTAKTFNFTKLNNNNYLVWKELMELFLREHNLWDVVTEEIPKCDEQWRIRDGRVRAFIVLALDDDQINHVHGKSTAAEMWLALEYIHDSFLTKVRLIKEISALKLRGGQNMDEHINNLTSLFQKLIDSGETELSEEWKIKFLLASLPENYKNVVLELGKRPEDDLTWSEVCSKLREDYELQKSQFAFGVQNSNFGNKQLINRQSLESENILKVQNLD